MTPESSLTAVRDGSEGAPPPAPPAAIAAPTPQPVQQPPDGLNDILANLRTNYANDPANQPAALQPPVAVALAPAVAAIDPTAPVVPPAAEGTTPVPIAATPAVATEPVAVEASTEPAIPAPESRLAPIFTLGEADDVTVARDAVAKLRTEDPIAHDNLMNGVYFANEPFIQQYALERLGIPAAKVQEFKDWVAAGTALPTVSTLPPFPEPNANGVVVIDGNELDLTVDPATGRANYPGDMLAYSNAKELYAMRTEREAAKAAEAATAQQQQAARDKQTREYHDTCFRDGANVYLDARMEVVKSLVAPAIANLAPEDKVLGDMFEAYIEQKIFSRPDIEKIALDAKEHLVAVTADVIAQGQRAGWSPTQIKDTIAARTREGRMINYAADQDRILRREIGVLKDAFLTNILRRNRAELAATATAPVVPATVQPITVATPPLDNSQPTDYRDILRQAQEVDRQAAAAIRR